MIIRLRNKLSCNDINVNAVSSVPVYTQNNQAIESLLTHWVTQVLYVFRRCSDEQLRSASALLHGIVSRSRTLLNLVKHTANNWLSWCELCSDVIHPLHLPVLLSHHCQLYGYSRSASISGYADMTVFNSSVFVSAAIKMFSSCMYMWSPGWSYLSFGWVTAVSTTWKNWLRK